MTGATTALTCHGHVDGHSIALLDALCLQPVGLYAASMRHVCILPVVARYDAVLCPQVHILHSDDEQPPERAVSSEVVLSPDANA